MPVGEPKRNDDVVSKYKSEEFDSEVEGVIYAMLMQYAKADSENAEKRAHQFAKILYKYSSKLINDLDVSNSVIAKKIANAIDNKIATELSSLSKDVDFESEISDIRKTVSDYLTSLISVANGDLTTSDQLGLTKETTQPQASQEKIDSELSESFIELIRQENTIAPDTRKMPVSPRDLTIPTQTLAKNATTLFGESISVFTTGLTLKTLQRLENIQSAMVAFGRTGALAANKEGKKEIGEKPAPTGGISDSHRSITEAIKVKRGSIAAHMTLIHSETRSMKEDQDNEEKVLKGWVTTVDLMKKQFDDAKKVVGTMITAPIKFASTAFKSISKNVQSTYKKVKNGSFFKFIFSPAGLLSLGLLGWAGYKLIFGGIGEKIKNTIAGIINSAMTKAIPILAIFFGTKDDKSDSAMTDEQKKEKEALKDQEIKNGIFGYLALLELTGKNEREKELEDQMFPKDKNDENDQGDQSFFSKLLGFSKDEAQFYSSLSIGENGFGGTADQVTDHWLENIKKMDSLVEGMAKDKWGMTPEEWLLSLGKDNTSKIDKYQGNSWITNIKEGLKTFWGHINNALKKGVEWFKGTSFGKSVLNTWDVIVDTCKSIYRAYKPIIDLAIKLSPLMIAVSAILAPPVGTILSYVSKIGRLFISLAKLSFLKPVLGSIASLLKENPLTGLLIAGIAIGLGALGIGIWNAFHRKPMDNGGIMPLEQYAISMGLARGQVDEYSIESRLGKWKKIIATYDVNDAKSVENMQKIQGIDMTSISLIENGLSRFEENYRLTMDDQDGETVGTLHWYILNRDKGSQLSRSIWARRLAELPILGIGPDLINESLYTSFLKELDTKFPNRDEKTWYSVRSMLMRMKDVDMVFRRLVDLATPKDIEHFTNSVMNEKDKIKAIYEWTRNGGGLNIQERMEELFGQGLSKKLNSIPNISISIYRNQDTWWRESHQPWDMYINVNGKTQKITFPSVYTKDIEPFYVFETLFSALSNEKLKKEWTENGGERFIVSSINPTSAARAFVNYMRRPDSGFYLFPPWNFSRDDVDKLKLSNDDETRVFRMSDIVSGLDERKQRTINNIKIQKDSAMNITNGRYKDYPNFDKQNDSKAMVGMIYVLGSILQLCDELDK